MWLMMLLGSFTLAYLPIFQRYSSKNIYMPVLIFQSLEFSSEILHHFFLILKLWDMPVLNLQEERKMQILLPDSMHVVLFSEVWWHIFLRNHLLWFARSENFHEKPSERIIRLSMETIVSRYRKMRSKQGRRWLLLMISLQLVELFLRQPHLSRK